MRALIFNSGRGTRLGALTADRPKAMVRLGTGETIFGRQLRVLRAAGVDEFVVTTGPWPGKLMAEAAPIVEAGCPVTFVPNPRYADTNYIVSMNLAAPFVRGEAALVLHGDLVFDEAWAREVVSSPLTSLGTADPTAPLPEKDFKARVEGGLVREVGVGVSGPGCQAFQPLYKLSGESLGIWLDAVARYVSEGRTGVYAEDAANEVFCRMRVAALSCAGHLVQEVDTPQDLERVSAELARLDGAAAR